MKPKIAITALIIAFLIGIILAVSFYSFVHILRVQEYEMHLKVSNMTGFNVGTDRVYFSKVVPGSTSSRDLIFYGDKKHDAKVSLEAFGNLSKWVYVSDNNFIIPKKGTKQITIKAHVPENATTGRNVTGTIKATFTRIW